MVKGLGIRKDSLPESSKQNATSEKMVWLKIVTYDNA